MKDNIFIKLSVKDGELSFPMKAQETKLNTFLKNLPDDAKLEMFIGITTDKGSNPQLARIHAMIRNWQMTLDIHLKKLNCKLKEKPVYVLQEIK